MGYKRSKLYHLKWEEGHELHGLEVTTRGLSVELMLNLAGKAAALAEGASTEGAQEVFQAFARRLVAWNLEDSDGAPVPATCESVMAQDMDIMLALILSWMEAIASVAPPLPAASSNGSSSLEGSLPMAPLSPSPGS